LTVCPGFAPAMNWRARVMSPNERGRRERSCHVRSAHGVFGRIPLIGRLLLVWVVLARVHDELSCWYDRNTKRGQARTVRRLAERMAGEAATQKRAAEAAMLDLMARFQRSGDDQLLKQLILHYSPLVTYVAERVRVDLPPNIEQRDLVSCGIFGLVDALKKFDVERAIRFETYAISRIRGAMLDEFGALVASRPPPQRRGVDADSVVLLQRIKYQESLARAIDRLPEHEKVIVTLLCVEGLTTDEIASILGEPISVVNTVYDRALSMLRKTLDVQDPLPGVATES
jgi:RNA polymerase sigma factor (sigma-70 family)